MFKKISLVFLIVLLWALSFFYHKAVLNTYIFSDDYSISLDLNNDYNHFFYFHDRNPLYVYKNDLLNKYVKWSKENKKWWLIYPNQQTIADINYISNIQYAASFREVFKAKYLANEFDYITSLSPYWVHVYVLWETILPINRNSDDFTQKDKITNWQYTTKFGEKWIYFNCDKNKIKNISSLKLDDYFKYAYEKKWEFYEKNSDPCKDMELASTLAFNYFYYTRDLEKAVKYYKVAGFHKKALPWIIGMVSVAQWMLGEHEKSIYAFLEKIANMSLKLKSENISKKEYESLINYYKTTIKRMQEEMNFYIISKVDKKHPECKKDYNCLQKYISWAINEEISICKQKVNLNEIKSVDDIIKNKDYKKNLQMAKCYLLALNIQNWFIKDGKLYSSLIKWWTYKYDDDKWTWYIFNIHKD